MATAFETSTCGRCGGTGSFSWNAVHGSTCYGCRGAGVQLTARGHAARAYFESLLKRRSGDVRPGMLVFWDDLRRAKRWRTVLSVGPAPSYYLNDDRPMVEITVKAGSQRFLPDHELKVVDSMEQRDELVAKALAYQATLNERGKPIKRAKATAE